MLWSSPRLEAARWLEACLVVESGSQPSRILVYQGSHFMGSNIASSRSWWRPGCNVREVSEGAGPNSVPFTLTRYGGLFEDGSDAAIDRLDALLGAGPPPAEERLSAGSFENEMSPQRVPRATVASEEAEQDTRALASRLVKQYFQEWA
jgi:hypothetical protein